jgi:Ca2+-binding EF-hand superfamily protein
MRSPYRLAILLLAATALAATAIPAAAQSQSPPPRSDRYAAFFKKVDTDHDGFISPAEAEAYAATRFDQLDTAHKGYLTLDDFEAPLYAAIDRASETRATRLEAALPKVLANFQALNKTGDGHLTKAEYLADSHARFAAADRDQDGRLSLDELRHARGHAF